MANARKTHPDLVAWTADELIRRLQHMYVSNSDSAQWYRNQIAQTLRRFNALPPKLDWE